MLPIKSSINTAGTVILMGSSIVKNETDIKPEPKPIVAHLQMKHHDKRTFRATFQIVAITSNRGMDIKCIKINI